MPYRSFLLAIFCLLIYGLPELSELLIYDRDKISQGEVWRLLSGNLVHFNLKHLFSDTAVFLIPAVLLEVKDLLSFRKLFILLSSLGFCLYFLNPNISYYAGLSGLNYALIFMLSFYILKNAKGIPFLALFVIALPLIKIVSEMATGELMFSDQKDANLIPALTIHLAGCVLGFFLPLAYRALGKRAKFFNACMCEDIDMKNAFLLLFLISPLAGCYSRPVTKSYNAVNKSLLGIPNNSKMKVGLVPKLSAHLIRPKKFNELVASLNPYIKMRGSMKYLGSDKKYHYYMYQESSASFRSMYKVLKSEKPESKEMPVTTDRSYWQLKSLTMKQLLQNRRTRITGSGNARLLPPHTPQRLPE